MSKGPVIVGVDDSTFTTALEVARGIARQYDLPLLYAHVVDRTERAGHVERAVHDVGASHGAEVAIEHGHPADRLVELSREREASFLVLGNHGPRSSLLGSISADVSRRAACPVVVVPPTVEHDAHDMPPRSSFEGGLAGFELGNPIRTAA